MIATATRESGSAAASVACAMVRVSVVLSLS